MVVVAVHLYNAMKGQLKWNGTMWSGSDYVVLWTVLANAMKWNSAYMDIMKQCYIFVKGNIMMEYHEAEYQKVPKIPSKKVWSWDLLLLHPHIIGAAEQARWTFLIL